MIKILYGLLFVFSIFMTGFYSGELNEMRKQSKDDARSNILNTKLIDSEMVAVCYEVSLNKPDQHLVDVLTKYIYSHCYKND